MSKVIFDISLSLDGYMTAANQTPEEPLGKDGLQLHDWALDNADATGRKMLEEGIASIGAVVCVVAIGIGPDDQMTRTGIEPDG